MILLNPIPLLYTYVYSNPLVLQYILLILFIIYGSLRIFKIPTKKIVYIITISCSKKYYLRSRQNIIYSIQIGNNFFFS